MKTEQTPIAQLVAEWLEQNATQAERFTEGGEASLLDLEAQIAATAPETMADLYGKIVVADAEGDMAMNGQQIALSREARAALGLPPRNSDTGLTAPAHAA